MIQYFIFSKSTTKNLMTIQYVISIFYKNLYNLYYIQIYNDIINIKLRKELLIATKEQIYRVKKFPKK